MRTKVITNIGQLITLNPQFFDPNRDPNKKSPDLGIIEGAALLLEDGKIKWVGSDHDVGWDWLDKYDVINANKNVVMPGLIDSHSHFVFAGSRHDEFEMRLEGYSYSEIAEKGGGILSTVEATRKASFEELYSLSLERLKGIQRWGVTTIESKSGYGLSTESELKILTVIKTLNDTLPIEIIPTFMGAHALAPEFDSYDQYTDHLCNEMIPAVAEKKLAKFCDVFTETGYFNIEQSTRILNTAKEYGMKLKVHADEFCNFYATAMALDLGATSADHLLYMDDAAVSYVAKSDMIATVMPGVSLFLNVKTAPARHMLDNGVNVAVATDFNPGSNMCQNLPLAMALACFMLKMSPAEVIKGVTLNAAKALDLDDRGSIEIGKRADLAFFKIPSYQYIFYNYGVNHLSRLMIEGEDVSLR